ncbi:hypothetical protein YC2023_036151 [Brassica napus]
MTPREPPPHLWSSRTEDHNHAAKTLGQCQQIGLNNEAQRDHNPERRLAAANTPREKGKSAESRRSKSKSNEKIDLLPTLKADHSQATAATIVPNSQREYGLAREPYLAHRTTAGEHRQTHKLEQDGETDMDRTSSNRKNKEEGKEDPRARPAPDQRMSFSALDCLGKG